MSAPRHHNVVALSTPRDVGAQLMDRLQSAYEAVC
jgi:hypothetical protein